MSESQTWYIVKAEDGSCHLEHKKPPGDEHWGPFASREQAIARRVGLIRAGKCQPQ